jgi:hypothetical protein
MASILKKPIRASKLVWDGKKMALGEKIEIRAGQAIEKGDDNPSATTIVIAFNGEKYVTDKALLESAIQRRTEPGE